MRVFDDGLKLRAARVRVELPQRLIDRRVDAAILLGVPRVEPFVQACARARASFLDVDLEQPATPLIYSATKAGRP